MIACPARRTTEQLIAILYLMTAQSDELYQKSSQLAADSIMV